jgi:hypothetical protein
MILVTPEDLEILIAKAVKDALNSEIASHRLSVDSAGRMLNPSEVRDVARCGNNTVYAALKSGVLPSVSVGKGPRGERRLIKTSDAEAWAAKGNPV